jgi:hypothetical protein
LPTATRWGASWRPTRISTADGVNAELEYAARVVDEEQVIAR